MRMNEPNDFHLTFIYFLTLQSFVHVSKAFLNCIYNSIDEKIYDPPIDPHKLIDLMELLDEK